MTKTNLSPPENKHIYILLLMVDHASSSVFSEDERRRILAAQVDTVRRALSHANERRATETRKRRAAAGVLLLILMAFSVVRVVRPRAQSARAPEYDTPLRRPRPANAPALKQASGLQLGIVEEDAPLMMGARTPSLRPNKTAAREESTQALGNPTQALSNRTQLPSNRTLGNGTF